MARFEALGATSWDEVDALVRARIGRWLILSPGGLPQAPASRTVLLGDASPGVGLAGQFLYDASGPQSALRDLFPTISPGAPLVIDMELPPRVTHYPPLVSGVAASVGEEPFLPLTLFDTHALAHTALFLPGSRCIAAVSAVALRARRPKVDQIQIDTPDWARTLPLEERFDGPMTVNLSGLAMWLPSTTYADAAAFRGEVLRADPIGPTPFGNDVWACDVVVSRAPGDVVIRIVVPEAAWRTSPPASGDEMEGFAWVQGRLVARLGSWFVQYETGIKSFRAE